MSVWFNRSGVVIWLAGVYMMACTTDNKQPECLLIVVVSPVITITNSAQQPICDATVVAKCTGVDAGTTIAALGPDGYPVDAAAADCTYGLYVPDCNSFTLFISHPDYQATTVPNVEIRYSQHCPGPIPDPQRVDVELESN